jgi:hypothetical protein
MGLRMLALCHFDEALPRAKREASRLRNLLLAVERFLGESYPIEITWMI